MVSGQWKIDIRNRDGSLAKHLEFENALTYAAALYNIPQTLFGVNLASKLTADPPVIGVNVNGDFSPTVKVAAAFPYLQVTPSAVGPCGGYGCLIVVDNSASQVNCEYFANNSAATNAFGYSASTCHGGLFVFSNAGSYDSFRQLYGRYSIHGF